ncbi:mechanosensitive ion channel family protein [Saccharopolyspora sp. K220]|uniref:mechanosensitive ion channel domain-containing protein n=1 Tax=Saccharopolyspora soli TaxID=2926618 RepID=UPI001F5AF414|nr:mechanosensitive ion channel family protein [Saccharopolyspora soli]MCI2418443.1 mechanosensitive ion channel family protein [Saccharopolyspora soli]
MDTSKDNGAVRGRRRWNLKTALNPRRFTPSAKRAVITSALALVMLVAATPVNPAALFRDGQPLQKAAAVGGAVLFAALGMIAVHNIAREVGRRTRIRLSASHAGAIRLAISIVGYATVAILALDELGVRVDQLLLGGAVTGVIIGIASQQSLGNVFAGLMLVISRPFTVGDHLTVHSGSLGGPLEGYVTEMGLVYLTLEGDDGVIRVPNTAVLNSAVAPNSRAHSEEPSQSAETDQANTA